MYDDSVVAGKPEIYECTICGYKYDISAGDPDGGIEPGTHFSELPDGWTCPLCGAEKDMFKKMENSESPSPEKQEVVKEYKNKDIIVYWYPNLCSHAGKCWGGSPAVFKPKERPWINLDASPAEQIIRTIDECPSQALRYELPKSSSVNPDLANGPGSIHHKMDKSKLVKIRVIKNGPLLIEGPTQIIGPQNKILKESDRFVLCRCGKTKNEPYCDGSHIH